MQELTIRVLRAGIRETGCPTVDHGRKGKVTNQESGGAEPEEDDGMDRVGLNPTGLPRKSSARTRRKKERRLFRGTPWDREERDGE